jgi:hypothetical protein
MPGKLQIALFYPSRTNRIVKHHSITEQRCGAVRVSQEQGMSQKVTLSWATMWPATRALLERGHAVRAAR